MRDAQKKQNQVPASTQTPSTQIPPTQTPSTQIPPTTDQVQGGTIDVGDQDEEPTGRLTGPGAKTARKPTQTQMTAEVLGRERR